MTYLQPVFRPPSEGNSLIIQLTEGCSYNQCTFCPMYKTKIYKKRSVPEFITHLDYLAKNHYYSEKRAFIGDGDALSADTDYLIQAIELIKEKFPLIRKIGIYGSVFSLKRKKIKDLQQLRALGLRYIYLGIESGDEQVLKRVKKYMNKEEMIRLCQMVIKAGIALSVTIVIGLGGKDWSERHVLGSGDIINRIAPTYTSLLNLMLEHTVLKDDPNYNAFNLKDYGREVIKFINNINSRTIFRANHASNYIPLKGVLPRDKVKLINFLMKEI